MATPEKPFYLSVKVAILDGEGRCLLLKRSQSSKGNPGKWELPGGKVDPGEDFDKALVREVIEETGLSVALEHVFGSAERELPHRKIAYLIMEGRLKSGRVSLSEEHDDFIWVDPEELPKMDLLEQLKEFARILADNHTSRR
jgi:8-oxo-dGTP diphosphatase